MVWGTELQVPGRYCFSIFFPWLQSVKSFHKMTHKGTQYLYVNQKKAAKDFAAYKGYEYH